jgi:uncharacterized protein YprB with RNaseH-like and TPR domain
MLSDAIRRRLEQLNRAPLGSAPVEGGAPLQTAPLNGAAAAAPQRQLTLLRSAESPDSDCRPSATEFANAAGAHLRLRRPLASFFPRGGFEQRAGDRQPGEPRSGVRVPAANAGAAAHPELLALAAHDPRGALYLDLETCGFAGSMIFLVGLVWWDEGQLWLDQLLARNYAEERAMLATLGQISASLEVLVTFNGKSFDWPMVKDRSTLHRLSRGPRPAGESSASDSAGSASPTRDLVHCDLLHHARRRWRGRLSDCRLQTLERAICRRHRSGDVPGALVPAVYHAYVRSGDLRVIEPVLHHNALDLVTLVQIGQALISPATSIAQSA